MLMCFCTRLDSEKEIEIVFDPGPDKVTAETKPIITHCLNYAVEDGISDHSPLVVDLPLAEPPLANNR